MTEDDRKPEHLELIDELIEKREKISKGGGQSLSFIIAGDLDDGLFQ